MSAHCVDNMSEELVAILEGDNWDNLSFDIGIPNLAEDNTFQGINSFGPVFVNGDLTVTGNRIENEVFNLSIEDVVITLGTGGSLPAGDRGLVLTADVGPHPSMIWDHSEQEFRFGSFDVGTTVSEFPAPSSYANLRAGDIDANTLNISDISVTGAVSTPELQVDSLKTTTGEDYLAAHITPGNGINVFQDPENSSNLIVERPARIKETAVMQQRKSVGSVVTIGGAENIADFDINSVDVFVNGVLVLEGSELDYTIVSGGIKFSFPLEMNDAITVTTN